MAIGLCCWVIFIFKNKGNYLKCLNYYILMSINSNSHINELFKHNQIGRSLPKENQSI